jgi:8-oxo-dGTP diphosphatase
VGYENCYTSEMDFAGVKIALMVGDKLLLHLRDNKPGLFNANMWDFIGGGREGSETPTECVVREVKEELGITLSPEVIVWQKVHPSQKDPNRKSYFMVAPIPESILASINLTEGQKWELFTQNHFFKNPQVIEALKTRFRDYLNSK